MAGITRQSIIHGPGAVIFDSQTLHDKDGINAAIETPSDEARSSVSGKLFDYKTDQQAKITATPCGVISSGLLGVLFPAAFSTPTIGADIFGSTDKPLVIWGKDGRKVTFHAAALTKCPDIVMSPAKTSFGSAEWTALLANGVLPTESSALLTEAAGTYAALDPDPAGLTGYLYTGTIGALTIADTVDGWSVQVEPTFQPISTDNAGTVGMILTGVTVRASCTPLGKSLAEVLALLPYALGRGASLAGAADLTIEGGTGSLSVVLKNARVVTGPVAWGSGTLRAGQIGFTATRAFANGVAGALFSVGIKAAPQG